ncbi:hypothetical protein BJ875DRAFT_353452, partial [Amylocarpus encephaloides]
NPTTLVTFVIGGEDKIDIEEFFVFNEFSCYHSPVWKAALNGNFLEGNTLTNTMEDVEPKVFRLLAQWLYSGTFEDLQQARSKRVILKAFHGVVYRRLALLWGLIEMLLMPPLQNAAMLALCLWSKKYDATGIMVFNHVFDNTASGSPLRKLCVAQ